MEGHTDGSDKRPSNSLDNEEGDDYRSLQSLNDDIDDRARRRRGGSRTVRDGSFDSDNDEDTYCSEDNGSNKRSSNSLVEDNNGDSDDTKFLPSIDAIIDEETRRKKKMIRERVFPRSKEDNNNDDPLPNALIFLLRCVVIGACARTDVCITDEDDSSVFQVNDEGYNNNDNASKAIPTAVPLPSFHNFG